MSKKSILVVDDEDHILELIGFNLEQNGFSITKSSNGEDGLKRAFTGQYDLVVLDLMLPGIDGVELCKELRQNSRTKDIPIIMLTARGEEMDRVVGLEVGADDYITKPFSVRELVARIKAVLRRTKEIEQNKDLLILQDLSIDINKHQVSKDGEVVDLTLKEFELLKILVQNKGKVLTRDFLLDEIWGYEYFGETRTVDVHIRHLRKKLGDEEGDKYIDTIRGIGYRIS